MDDLVRNDPESEASIPALTDVLRETLFARIAVHEPLETPEDAARVAAILADATVDSFEVSKRASDKPRYSWE